MYFVSMKCNPIIKIRCFISTCVVYCGIAMPDLVRSWLVPDPRMHGSEQAAIIWHTMLHYSLTPRVVFSLNKKLNSSTRASNTIAWNKYVKNENGSSIPLWTNRMNAISKLLRNGWWVKTSQLGLPSLTPLSIAAARLCPLGYFSRITASSW